jgi:acetoin utilization deacetylase AcuC-like enzyme
MKVVFDKAFHSVYTSDPASAPGRIEAITNCLPPDMQLVEPQPASLEQLKLAHSIAHINDVRSEGLYDIAALAAGAAILTARIGFEEPCFGVIRPPGHHASEDSAWGFCFFNNIAIALLTLKSENLIQTSLVLDIDLHYGDGTVNILGDKDWVSICNPVKNKRIDYLKEVEEALQKKKVDMIAISAGFDHHLEDWGGLLATEDYFHIGRMVREVARQNESGCFGILEGGYNHKVLGQNVAALINGMSE